MPLFKLEENRYLDTDHIADITYTPANSLGVVVTVAGNEAPPDIPFPANPSYLNIDLKSTEHIRFEGEEADATWAAFEAVTAQPLHSDGETKMTKEYATVLIENGKVFRIDTGAPNATPAAAQFDGLKGFPLVYALNKLAEVDFSPLHGVIDHGQMHPGAANYTVICAREK